MDPARGTTFTTLARTGDPPTDESPAGKSPTGESPTDESPRGKSPTGRPPTGESVLTASGILGRPTDEDAVFTGDGRVFWAAMSSSSVSRSTSKSMSGLSTGPGLTVIGNCAVDPGVLEGTGWASPTGVIGTVGEEGTTFSPDPTGVEPVGGGAVDALREITPEIVPSDLGRGSVISG